MLRRIIQSLTTDKDVTEQLKQTLNLEKLYSLKAEELQAEIQDIKNDKTLLESVKEYVIGFMRLSLPVLEAKEMEEVARRYNANCLTDSPLETFLYDQYIKDKDQQHPYLRQLAIETLARCAARGGFWGMHNFGKYVVAENESKGGWKASAAAKDLLIAIIILNATNVDYFGEQPKGEMKDLADLYKGFADFVKDDKEAWYWSNLYSTKGKAHFDCTHNLETSLFSWLTSNEQQVASLVESARSALGNKNHLYAAQQFYRAAEQISNIGKKQLYYDMAYQAVEKIDRVSSLRVMAEILHALRAMLTLLKSKTFDDPGDITNAQRVLPLYTTLKKIFDAKMAPYQAALKKAVTQEAQRTHDLKTELSTKPEKRVSIVTFSQFKPVQDPEEKPHESPQALSALDSLADIVNKTKYKV